MRIALALVCGYVLDLLFADPQWMPHPVVLMGRCITALEKLLRRCFPKTQRGTFAAGLVLAAVLPLGTWLICGGILLLLGRIHPLLQFALETFWCYQALAVKGMAKEGRNVCRKLTEGTLEEARQAVARIVGRDTECMGEEGVIKAAVESVAENFCDGIAAPMLFLALGGAPLGLAYKAVSTMDSMVGYRNEKYLHFGRAAARLDDAANFIPARLSALLLILSAGILRQNPRRALRIWRRDRRNHASPNSAQTESVMAGALGLQLAGPASYGGVLYEKPPIGDAERHAEAEDILRACRMIYVGSALCLVLLCALRIGFVLR